MAHFAKLDSNNQVIQVVVISENDTSDSNGVHSESIGIAFCQKLYGADTTWLETYKNGTRGNFAGIGYSYMPSVMIGAATTDIFIEPRNYDSWEIGATEAKWVAPIATPGLTTSQEASGCWYEWDESGYQADTSDPKTVGWVLKNLPSE